MSVHHYVTYSRNILAWHKQRGHSLISTPYSTRQLPLLIQDTHHLSDMQQPLSHKSHPPGTHHPWVGRGSMEWDVYLTLLHMTAVVVEPQTF